MRHLTRRAYGIGTDDDVYQRQLKDEYGVKMTIEDEHFYLDNCIGPYKATCTNTVSKDWVKQKNRKKHNRDLLKKGEDQLRAVWWNERKSEMREMLATPMVEIDDDPNFQYETPSEQTVPSG